MGRRGERVDGVLLLDKPRGMSSNAAVQSVKRLLNAAKAGHTGTLDPEASGLLPIALGDATKFSDGALLSDKRYQAALKLGVTTTTADVEGEVVECRPVRCTEPELKAALARFVGEIRQTPPMHSAIKVRGIPLYKIAREGLEVERPARAVTIHSIDILGWQGDWLSIDVHCSKGTYIRTLAADIGQALGCGAHLSALRRTAVGHLRIEDATTLDALAALGVEAAREARLRTDVLIADLPLATLGDKEAGRLRFGMTVPAQGLADGLYRVYGQDHGFMGTARVADGVLRPERLVAFG